jgi:arylsulfatase A-like enzyme
VGTARRVAALLAVVGLACSDPAGPAEVASGEAPNVVLITLESLRTDHVGAYGGVSATRPEQAITPVLDAFAREAVLYERAYSVTSWTLSSHASLFTGLYPSAHQTRLPLARLGDDYRTLAEELADEGYQTGAVVSGPYLRAKHNLTQGFDYVDDSSASPFQPRAHSDITNPKIEAGLVNYLELERDPERPFLLFAYFWDPHFDFLPPAPYDQSFVSEDCEPIDVHDFDTSSTVHPGISPAQLAYVVSQYDGEIRATDAALGRVFEILRGRGLWDDTLVIITADHGEEFFEHGEKAHKKNLYEETLHVPLLVKYPTGTSSAPRPGTRDARLASLVDVMPTVLEVVGRAVPAPMHGRSLLVETDPERPLFFELLSSWYVKRAGRVISEASVFEAVRRGDHKLVAVKPHAAAERMELYDLRADPREQRDLSASEPALLAELASLLQAQRGRTRDDAARFQSGGEAELSESEAERLRALGYLLD